MSDDDDRKKLSADLNHIAASITIDKAIGQISTAINDQSGEHGTFGRFASDTAPNVAIDAVAINDASPEIVALRKRCEALSAAMDRISTAIDEHRPSLEPGTFGRFVADTVAGVAPRLVSDVAMGAEGAK